MESVEDSSEDHSGPYSDEEIAAAIRSPDYSSPCSEESARRRSEKVTRAAIEKANRYHDPHHGVVSRRLRAAIEKAKDKVILDLATADARARLDECDYAWFDDHPRPVDFTLQGMHEAEIARLKLKATAKNNLGTWLTISPPDMTVEEFGQGIRTFLEVCLTMGTKGVFTVEQRSENPGAIRGIHMHCLLPEVAIPKRTLEPSVAEAFWGKRSFRPLPQQFCVKYTHTETDNLHCLDYMDPSKCTKATKVEKLDNDKILREKLGLEDLNEF